MDGVSHMRLAVDQSGLFVLMQVRLCTVRWKDHPFVGWLESADVRCTAHLRKYLPEDFGND